MSKPNYKRAAIELSKILKAAEKRRGISSKSSETTQGIKDVTEESSETAYQFTDFDLTVFKNEDVEDDSDENKEQQEPHIRGGFCFVFEMILKFKNENKDHYTAVNRHRVIAGIVDIALYILF